MFFSGRMFYKCDGGKCKFFTWADEPIQSAPRQPARDRPVPGGYNNTPNRSMHTSTQQGRQPLTDIDNQPVCECGQPTIILTVRKDGPNQGIVFSCAMCPGTDIFIIKLLTGNLES